MLRAIRPAVARLERRFRSLLKERPYDFEQIRTLIAITPVGAARASTLSRFFQQVDTQGRRLAQWNVPPSEVEDLLSEFDTLLDCGFHPAREQLQLATMLALRQAYYEVRETESQAFFGICRAREESATFDDVMRLMVATLARALHARRGSLALGTPRRTLSRCKGTRWSVPLPELGELHLEFATSRRAMPRELALLESAAAWARNEAHLRRLQLQARDAEDQERRRIGRELHDEAGQSLVALRLDLEMMEQEAPASLRPRLARARRIAGQTVVELRRIIASLSPAVLERLGLERALHQLAARFQDAHRTSIRTRIPAGIVVAEALQPVIYRVAQESLNNVARHSRATHVNLSLRIADHWVRLSVADDGAGFCTKSAEQNALSFGLEGMRERAALLGGTLLIRSAPGKGTTVVLELPRGA